MKPKLYKDTINPDGSPIFPDVVTKMKSKPKLYKHTINPDGSPIFPAVVTKNKFAPLMSANEEPSGSASTSACQSDARTQTEERFSSMGNVISDLLFLKNNLLDCVKSIDAVVDFVRSQLSSNGLIPEPSRTAVDVPAFSSDRSHCGSVPPIGQLHFLSPDYKIYCSPETSSSSDPSGRLGRTSSGLIGRGSPFGSFRSSKRVCRRVRELFITKVSRETSDQDLLDFVSRHVRPIHFQKISHPSAYHSSFLLAVSDIDVRNIMNPEIWPMGVECRFFKRPMSGWLAHGCERSPGANGYDFCDRGPTG